MSGKVAVAGSMMSDFRAWDHDHLNWMTEIQGWRTDHTEAQGALEQIQQLLLEYGRELAKHLQSISIHQQVMRDSSREVDEYQRSGFDLAEKARASQRALHARQMEVHEAIRARHHALQKQHVEIMARLASFVSTTGNHVAPSD